MIPLNRDLTFMRQQRPNSGLGTDKITIGEPEFVNLSGYAALQRGDMLFANHLHHATKILHPLTKPR